jgi:hypothetical protein
VPLIRDHLHSDPTSAAFSVARNRASKVRLLLEQGAPDLALRNADSLVGDVREFVGSSRLAGHQRERLEDIAWSARADADPCACATA